MKNKKIWCGRCGKPGVYRKTTDKNKEVVCAIYICSNPVCNKVESIVLKAFGSTAGPLCGILETLNKKHSKVVGYID